MKFVCLLAKKNLLFRRNFGRSYERRHSKFSPTHLLEGWWVTVQGYLQNNLNNLKTKKQDLGALPKPHSHLRGRRGRWQNQPTYPTRVLGRFKASRVKCTASPPLTPFHLHENTKRSEADGAGNLSRLAKQPRSSSLYRLEATKCSVVGV